MMTKYTGTGVELTRAAALCVEESGIDPMQDLHDVLMGKGRQALLDDCHLMPGQQYVDRVEGWTEYVDAIMLAAMRARRIAP